MNVVVHNSFGEQIVYIIKSIIESLLNFWELINYSFGVIPLSWLNSLFGLDSSSEFYFTDFDISFLSCITSGLIVILVIHVVKLIIE